MSAQRRRRPTIAKGWQLAVLKKLHAESENPTDEQHLAVVEETGLDTKWVKKWFTRQRSRKKGPLSTAPTFRVQLSRSLSTPSDPAPPVACSDRTPTYSRDPLCHRYPDFSQFFRPQRRTPTFEPANAPLANPNTDSMSLSQLGNLFMDPASPSGLQSCPVAFSVRLLDLLVHL